MKKILLAIALSIAYSTTAFAQTAAQSDVGFLLAQGSTYGSYTCPASATSPCFVQYGSAIPVTPSTTPGTPLEIDITKTGGVIQLRGAGTVGTGSERVAIGQDSTTNAGSSPQRTIVTLDVKTVTTGATAVTALTAGHRNYGGFLTNPKAATTDLCINEIGTAVGTTSSGDTTCILPGQSYTISPSAAAVSVITSDSSHPFSGYGLN